MAKPAQQPVQLPQSTIDHMSATAASHLPPTVQVAKAASLLADNAGHIDNNNPSDGAIYSVSFDYSDPNIQDVSDTAYLTDSISSREHITHWIMSQQQWNVYNNNDVFYYNNQDQRAENYFINGSFDYSEQAVVEFLLPSDMHTAQKATLSFSAGGEADMAWTQGVDNQIPTIKSTSPTQSTFNVYAYKDDGSIGTSDYNLGVIVGSFVVSDGIVSPFSVQLDAAKINSALQASGDHLAFSIHSAIQNSITQTEPDTYQSIYADFQFDTSTLKFDLLYT